MTLGRALLKVAALLLGHLLWSATAVAEPATVLECGCAHTHMAFHLPFPSGTAYPVIQGNLSQPSHTGHDSYAWDFAVPVGSPVAAARDGIVVQVVQHFDDTEGGRGERFADRANTVVVDHGDGKFSVYQHLARASVAVRVGDSVLAGQVLAASGNSGYSLQPHLHFEVTDYKNQSMPICFLEVPGGVPRVNQTVVSSNRSLQPSTLPEEAFASNGVRLDSRVPARVFQGATPLEIAGTALWPAVYVVAYFLPFEGGEAVQQFVSPLAADGSFRIRVDLAGLEGPLGFAMALADGDGRFDSRFSVPVVVTPDAHRARSTTTSERLAARQPHRPGSSQALEMSPTKVEVP